ncbi:hypothetical protein AB0I81_22645 [Nonomuraea sp. NPDC050404]|uniref:hypothetical protein n=1 Tax=Nonomuraea sp. NPDC050404 TaxID=3155783 RepID=UPI003403AACD
MRLELDLSGEAWPEYGSDSAVVKRAGVVAGDIPHVRLAATTGQGPATLTLPWPLWQAAHRKLAEHFGEQSGATASTDRSPVLDAIEEAMREHEHRWGLGPDHPDGTDSEEWTDTAEQSLKAAIDAAIEGELTWAHAFVEAADAVMATDDPTELIAALARVAGAAATWIEAIKERS